MSEQDSFDNEQWLEGLPKRSRLLDEEYDDSPIPDSKPLTTFHYVARPKDSVLYVAAILAEDWLVDTHSYDLEALKAHYKATLWTEHADSVTGNAEWFGESDGVLFVIITATKALP